MKSGSTGVIGIGHMGLAMAGRLRERGRSVFVRDVRAEREAMAERDGATPCATPAALARQCGEVIVAVVDAAQTEDVLFGVDGVAAAMVPGACVVLCPTIAPDSVESFASRLDALGIDWIEAPMSGGPARARAGTMSLMVACRDDVFARQAALLATLADPVFRLGARAGDGARTKLVNNLLAAINLAGAAEAIALAERVGLDPARTLAVIERSSGQSWIGSDRMARALAGDTAPRAHASLLAKDSRLALALAEAAGVDAKLGAVAAAMFANAVAQGRGDLDDSCLLDLLRASRR
ncbi:MAG TPA: NAD(P)-dependent oxidoreductase [Caldimonas sp.]|nr:NAD(P)-dependent oxidoreductase [Caldimonas sp.]